ncbi:glycosyltransferase [Acidisoma cellulosilytica]|uniref:Glycosyltransferase n=1 Tax=Acidisoma cellulosilyticum TaxID=2802395 RepID=A0A963YZE1_9PROT|nr:glycosyltransferase [Acidisoma cellulosilyticum]MCB8878978.1 glycosyltransferase [Acidisoma cellulosilyticum]
MPPRNRPPLAASLANLKSDWLLSGPRKHNRPEVIGLAIDAWERGEKALAKGDLAAARFALERATRLGPDDTQVRFLLGITMLRQGDPSCVSVFRALIPDSDTQPAHRGLLSALMLGGDREEQIEAAGALLSRFAAPKDADFSRLASDLALRAGRAGWCAADADGRVTLVCDKLVEFRLDGELVRPKPDRNRRFTLPASWTAARSLTITAAAQNLLGSPIDLTRHRIVEGFVSVEDGDLNGWAWCPANPDTAVLLSVEQADGRKLPLTIKTGEPAHFPDRDGLSLPLAFRVPAATLLAYPGLLHIRDRYGRDITGSPIDPGRWTRSAGYSAELIGQSPGQNRKTDSRPAERLVLPIWVDTPPPERHAKASSARGTASPAVVIPVYRGLDMTLRCLARVFATVPRGTKIIVVDDASPEPALAEALDALARKRRIHLIRNPRNLGFPGSVNRGIAAAGGRDVVLLNSDALVPPGWLTRLRDAARSAPDIGTVAPLSNDATILSYPRVNTVQAPPEEERLDEIDAFAQSANGGDVVEIPTSVGFCMYVRGACLEETGAFRENIFAQGYGEENDFCLRARHLGWRHMAATGIFVSHIGGQSFRAARVHLLRRNQALLERLHPGYGALISRHNDADPLAPARARLDMTRWKAWRRPKHRPPSVIIITHDEGGGVERQIGTRIRELAAKGLAAIILRPQANGICQIEPGTVEGDAWHDDFPNLCFSIPDQMKELLSFLRFERSQHIELHHRLGHDHALLELPKRLGIPLDIYVHDYAAICPRVTLVTTTQRYCGEPDTVECEACIADLGSRLREDIPVAALRQRTANDFAAARQVIFPAAEVERRFRRYLGQFDSAVRPWEQDGPIVRRLRPAKPNRDRSRTRIGIIGAIGTEKGYDVLLACARDAARRRLPLDFIVIGFTHDDVRLIETGQVQITYRFSQERAVEEIAAQDCDLAFIPSIWPETWCFALSDAWKAGLKTAVFDIGTPAQRVRETDNGWVLPLALPPSNLNNMLISLAQSEN